MRKCKSCGRTIEGNNRFCLMCGAKIEDVDENLDNNTTTDDKSHKEENLEVSTEELKELQENDSKSENNSYDNSKKNNNEPQKKRGNKIILIPIILIIILFFSYNQLKNYMSNPQNVIENFKVAILENDEQKLIDSLETESSALQINEESAKVIIDYFNKNPKELDEIINSLNKDAESINKDAESINKNDALINIFNLNSDEKKKIFYIENSKKSFLGLNKVKVYVKPIFINVTSNVSGVKFFVNNNEICESDKDDFSFKAGPFVPGEYELSYKFDSEFVNLEESETIDFIENKSIHNNEFNYEIGNELKYVTLKTSEKSKDAIVCVNGKNTGKKVDEMSNLGPILEDTKISIEIKQGDSVLKSDEIKVGERSELYIDLDNKLYEYEVKNNKQANQSEKNSISFNDDYSDLYYSVENLVKDYTYNFTVAVNNNDFGAIKKYLYPGKELYKSQPNVIKQFFNDGIKEELVDISVEKINILDKQELSGTVETIEKYNIKQNNEEKEKVFNSIYEFKFNNTSKNYELTNMRYLNKLN
ncbi:zinc ribbon domain-containing protein [Clostridium perfringens]|nr:zinc ribbon domain-containing protein [Clostridium perfringens]